MLLLWELWSLSITMHHPFKLQYPLLDDWPRGDNSENSKENKFIFVPVESLPNFHSRI